jgi:hypothetical protein
MIKGSPSFSAPGPSIHDAKAGQYILSAVLQPPANPPSPNINVEIKMPESKEIERGEEGKKKWP